MRRKLFFWLDRLQITPGERKAVALLVVVLTGLLVLNMLIEQRQVYDESYYETLEQAFKDRAERIAMDETLLLSRYEGTSPENKAESEGLEKTEEPILETADVPVKGPQEMNAGEANRININTAGKAALQELPGIGPSYAQNIIDYRREHGPFKSIEELLNVKGIGKKRLENLKPFIKL